MSLMRMLRLPALAAAAVLLVASCASSHVLTGTPRPPVDPSQVRIYYGPPPGRFEEIAVLQASSGAFTWGEQNKTNAVMNRLRREAAALGANGILFQGTADGWSNSGVSVGAGGGRVGGSSFSSVGVGVNISPQQRQASGIAIFVEDPPPAEGAPEPRP